MMRSLLLVILFILLVACAPVAESTPTVLPSQTSSPPTATLVIPSTVTPAPTQDAGLSQATETPAALKLDPLAWKSWPVIPSLAPEMLAVYQAGQELGRDAHVVSVVGDCESSSEWFLKDFARGKRFYSLGPYAHLQETIDYFNPSLGYFSYAAIRGAKASTVLTSLWADPKVCENNETPLACEYRVRNPAFAIIALGTNDVYHLETFEPKMREIIDYTLSQGIVPVLVTKADNLEGDDSINTTIARLAAEYHVPLWNFWAAVQALPNGGLQEDGAHLTFAGNFFDEPANLKAAWPVRNLTALQTLEALRLAVQGK